VYRGAAGGRDHAVAVEDAKQVLAAGQARNRAARAVELRRVFIAAGFWASHPGQPAPEEINVIRLAWEDIAA
jgi:hypothetical protein